MIHAYNEIYLDDAMITLAELFSYVNTPNDADVLFNAFIDSGKSFQFERNTKNKSDKHRNGHLDCKSC